MFATTREYYLQLLRFLFMGSIQEWFNQLKWRYRQRHNRRYQKMSVPEVFATIYKENTWGGQKGTFFSGSGTADPNTKVYIEKLVQFIQANKISSIVEVGCGDFSIMQKVLQQAGAVDYLGLDVVPELIDYNTQNFSGDKIKFATVNAIADPLPKGDLLVIRQVLQHLNNDAISIVLDKVKAYPYALITEHQPITDDVQYNIDKTVGPNIRMKMNSGVFIDKPPFSLHNTSVFLEYRADDPVKKKIVPAVMRTYLYEKNK